jgi:hypothetical protein
VSQLLHPSGHEFRNKVRRPGRQFPFVRLRSSFEPIVTAAVAQRASGHVETVADVDSSLERERLADRPVRPALAPRLRGPAALIPNAKEGRVEVLSRRELHGLEGWRRAFTAQHKDWRYYEIVQDTIHPEFEHHYLAFRDAGGGIIAMQPFFLLDQDLLAGVNPAFRANIDRIRRHWPGLMRLRTLMVGCAAGEGHLDGDADHAELVAQLLAGAITVQARRLGARMVVLKEFPRQNRRALRVFTAAGFGRIPSMPMTRRNIAYPDFDSYMQHALNGAVRRNLRRKFAASESAGPLEMSVVTDIGPWIDEVFPLYRQVYDRSRLRFEKLTKVYFCELGRRMPDKARFFVWRQGGKAVAFAECLVHQDTLFAEYLGLDYDVAIRLHLYHRIYRDVVSWAMAQGYRWFQSSGLNYDPKLHLRHSLEPIDLYVRGTSSPMNAMIQRLLPLIEPTHYDPTLPKFHNYADLWDDPPK